MTLREWFTVDMIPVTRLNFLFVPAAAIMGGLAFSYSGSWWKAIEVDAGSLIGLWILVFPASLITNLVVDGFRWLFRLS